MPQRAATCDTGAGDQGVWDLDATSQLLLFILSALGYNGVSNCPRQGIERTESDILRMAVGKTSSNVGERVVNHDDLQKKFVFRNQMSGLYER